MTDDCKKFKKIFFIKKSVVCCQFKLLRENCHLNIEYDLIECHKHSMKKVILYLNYRNDTDV